MTRHTPTRRFAAGFLLGLFALVLGAQSAHRASHWGEGESSHCGHEQWLSESHEDCALCDLLVLPVFDLAQPVAVKAPSLFDPTAEPIGSVQPVKHRAAEYTALRGPPVQG